MLNILLRFITIISLLGLMSCGGELPIPYPKEGYEDIVLKTSYVYDIGQTSVVLKGQAFMSNPMFLENIEFVYYKERAPGSEKSIRPGKEVVIDETSVTYSVVLTNLTPNTAYCYCIYLKHVAKGELLHFKTKR